MIRHDNKDLSCLTSFKTIVQKAEVPGIRDGVKLVRSRSIATNYDATKLVVHHENDLCKVMRLVGAEWETEATLRTPYTGDTVAVAMSPDGTRIAVGDPNAEVKYITIYAYNEGVWKETYLIDVLGISFFFKFYADNDKLTLVVQCSDGTNRSISGYVETGGVWEAMDDRTVMSHRDKVSISINATNVAVKHIPMTAPIFPVDEFKLTELLAYALLHVNKHNRETFIAVANDSVDDTRIKFYGGKYHWPMVTMDIEHTTIVTTDKTNFYVYYKHDGAWSLVNTDSYSSNTPKNTNISSLTLSGNGNVLFLAYADGSISQCRIMVIVA